MDQSGLEDQMGAHADFEGHYGGRREAVMAFTLIGILSIIFWFSVEIPWLALFAKIMLSLFTATGGAFLVGWQIARWQKGKKRVGHPSGREHSYRTVRSDADVAKALEDARQKGHLDRWEKDNT